MPVNVSHSSNPALTAQLAFQAGQGEYNKWKKQYEDQAEQQALQNAFRLSGEIRQNQAPFTNAKLRAWSQQKNAEVELKKIEALAHWRSSEEYATLESTQKLNSVKAHNEAASSHLSDQLDKVQPNIAKGVRITTPDGKEIVGTNENGTLDQKTAQAAIDRAYRQARSIDPSRMRPDAANNIALSPLDGGRMLMTNKETGQTEVVESARAIKMKSIQRGVETTYAKHQEVMGKALAEAYKESDAQYAKLAETRPDWTPEDLERHKKAARQAIREEWLKDVKPMSYFYKQFSDNYDMQMGNTPTPAPAEYAGQGWPGDPAAETKGWDAGAEQGLPPVDTMAPPPQPQGDIVDPRTGQVLQSADTRSVGEQRRERAVAESKHLDITRNGVRDTMGRVGELFAGADGSQTSTPLINDALLVANHVKTQLKALNEYEVARSGQGGIKNGTSLQRTKNDLVRLNGEMDQALVKIQTMLASSDGEAYAEENVKAELEQLGTSLSGKGGWVERMRSAWIPSETGFRQMHPAQRQAMSGVAQIIFDPGQIPYLPDTGQGIRSTGEMTLGNMTDFFEAANQAHPTDAVPYPQQHAARTAPRQYRDTGDAELLPPGTRVPDEAAYGLFSPGQNAARLMTGLATSGALKVPLSHKHPPSQSTLRETAQQLDKHPIFPGSPGNPFGQATDWENVVGRKFVQGADLAIGAAGGFWDWLTSFAPRNVDMLRE
ncbi:MAG: hypothetical protein CL928_15140 [Deltaproteobacteria bacterium]|nr:hypothetical protein [Deltaproteobacteria bacterium]